MDNLRGRNVTKREWKIVAATVTIVGVIFSILEAVGAPEQLVFGTGMPGYTFVFWVKLIMTSVAPIAYIVIDHWEDIKKRLASSG